MKTTTFSLALALFAFGCSKHDAVANLGVIELAPNSPKHVNIGGVDWTFTETVTGEHQPIIKAKSDWKVTDDDIKSGLVSPGVRVGTSLKMEIDLSTAPAGVEILGSFGRTQARYTLKLGPG